MSNRRHPRYPTIKDVAQRARVSKSLVSRALRGEPAVADETRRRIIEAAAELNYRPSAGARSLAARWTDTIGFVISGLNYPFWGEVVHAIDFAAERLGLSALYMSGAVDTRSDIASHDREFHFREMAAIERMLEYRIDGLGVGLSGNPDPSKLEEFASAVPLVAMMIDFRSDAFDTVTVDDAEGMRLAVKHLTKLGHRRIAYLGESARPVVRARVEGFRSAMAAEGLGRSAETHPCGLLQGDGYEAMQRLIRRQSLPTAVVAVTDRVARGAAVAATEAGLNVPGDLSIVGFDDSVYATAGQPLLTTVRVPRAEVGETTVQLIGERRDGRETSTVVLLRPTLVVRESTSGPPE